MVFNSREQKKKKVVQLGGSVLRLEKTHRESAVPSHPLTPGAESAGKGSWSQRGLGAGRGRLPQAFSTRSPGGGGLSRLVAGSVRWGPRGRVSRHGQCPCCGIEVSARTHSDAARGRPRESGADAGVRHLCLLHTQGCGPCISPGWASPLPQAKASLMIVTKAMACLPQN